MKDHSYYMNLCFDLAKRAMGKTSPNPYVGALIIDKFGNIISEGYHKSSGTDHAERDAIKNTNQNLSGTTLYCNLEPCCHTNKKTAPCAQFIIENQITKVVIANLDPNPQVAGKGVKLLKDAGIEVIVGIEKEKGARLNEVFFYHIQKKKPFIHLKWAQTLDGKIATQTFDSKWITSEHSRERVHLERNLYDAILVGANTINRDNPSLTTRIKGMNPTCPTRIIFSPSGNLNFEAKVFTDEFKEKTLVVTKKETTLPKNIKRLDCDFHADGPNYELLLCDLYKMEVTSIYIEGGSRIHNTFMKNNLYQRLSIYIAPKILGNGLSSVELNNYEKMNESIELDQYKWTQIGKDMLFESGENECLQD